MHIVDTTTTTDQAAWGFIDMPYEEDDLRKTANGIAFEKTLRHRKPSRFPRHAY